MRKYIIPFLLLHLLGAFFLPSYSQNHTIDSLKTIAQKNTADTAVIDANKQLSILLQEDDTKESIRYGFIALEKAKQLNDKFRIAHSYKTIGIAYDIKGNLDSCLLNLNEALAIFKTIDRKDYQSHTLTDKALAYYYRGNYELALRNHLAALDLRKDAGNEKYVAQSYNNIGLVYRSKKDYANAVKFYKQSYAIKAAIIDEPGMLNTLINIGAAYQSNGQFDSAYSYGLKGLQLATKINAADDIITCKENVAAALINLQRPNEGIVFLQEADKERAPGVNKKHLLTHNEAYGDLYRQENNMPLAIQYFDEALAIAKSNNRMEAAEVFYRKLAKCFYQQGDYKTAYLYADSGKAISDTLLNEENSRQVNEMSAVYETAEKETQIANLNAANAVSISETISRSRERNYFMLSSILFLGLAVVAYKAFTSNRKKKEQLTQQNVTIEKSLAEKEILLREIHHRVKNNLQIVSSLLSLQSNYIKDEQALDAVKESRNRVQSMSLIHQNLYQEDNLTGIDVQHYIGQLTDNLFQSYNIQKERIKLVKEIDQIHLDVDTVIPIGLILNELITNCLKYAFADTKDGIIKVVLKEKNNSLILSVYDNGAGLPPGFEQGATKSFGHKMISAFLQKLKGTMKMYTEGGTRVDIAIANYNLQ
ncbi:MAG: histidine kinase dimerization/phosphoacceptor domain -containing protein [Chitinophagaceae bacterium]